VTSATPDRPRATRSAEVAVPSRSGLGGGGGDAEDLAEPVGVDAGGDQDRDVDDPAALADLHRQRVGGHERVRPGVQGAVAEVLHQFVEITGHHDDLGLRQAGDPQRLDQPVHSTGGHSEQVAGRDHVGGAASARRRRSSHSGK